MGKSQINCWGKGNGTRKQLRFGVNDWLAEEVGGVMVVSATERIIFLDVAGIGPKDESTKVDEMMEVSVKVIRLRRASTGLIRVIVFALGTSLFALMNIAYSYIQV